MFHDVSEDGAEVATLPPLRFALVARRVVPENLCISLSFFFRLRRRKKSSTVTLLLSRGDDIDDDRRSDGGDSDKVFAARGARDGTWMHAA